MSNKSGTSSQVITLPSGGGALQGIGETFSPDLFTGTGNFTVPFALPPGRNGFQPKLALVYSTGNGNGPFGLGWDLSVPGVSRKTSKGIPRYRDNSADPKERDTFILSGSEDLVPVSESAPGVTRFQPRTEGLFARIERVQTGGNDFWEVRSKDGLVSLYAAPIPEGGDPSVVADPRARNKIFCWKLSQTTDPFGNRIDYQYLRDQGSEGPHVWDQLYLQKVQYVDYEKDGQTRFLVSVTFVYEERPDLFSEYRAGFNIRTRLRCKRIEIRTHADQDQLARTYELVYLDERVQAGELPTSSLPLNGVSLLSQVRVEGHDGNQTEKLPPLEFGYTRFAPERQRFQPIKAVNNALPPRSLGNDDFEMVNLFGNGLPDIVQMNGAVQFWRNLGNGLFDIPRTMNEVPAGVHLHDPGVQFADMNGDGRADLLVLQQGGYFPLSFQGRWSQQGFVQYGHSPSVNFGDNNTRLVDLDGDGVIDALSTGVDFELFFNDPLKGWETVETRPRQPLEVFPNLSFSDPRVKLADLTGDNLQDFVFVEQGQIDYWPYLGHGQWGRRVTMKNSPVFRDVIPLPGGGFDPKRVLLGDLDGDGLDDILYIEPNRLTFWINQGGERWSDPITITTTPPLTAIDAVRLADMLGTGMAGVLWTFDQIAGVGSNFQFLDLTGGLKPYLLEQMDNHMGAVTRIQYASSTKFYLADFEKPETRWKTPLPFPVQVVERVEVIDAMSGGKLTTEYRYHHGYWDGTEREFRGFGMVEQLDTETFADFHAPGIHGSETRFEPVLDKHFSPPLLTKTWFHQGPVDEEPGDWRELDWTTDYWVGDPQALAHTDGINAFLQTLTNPRHRRDAVRTLRGSTLRTELYALDGTDAQNRPYTVTEHAYGLREESLPESGDKQRQRIFFPHPLAQRTTQWERGDEPMTQFAFTDDYDAYGQSRRQVSLAVPRHRDYRVPASPGAPYLGTLTETQYAQHDDAQRYMVNRVSGSTSFEILNDGSPTVYDLYRQIQIGTAPRKLFGQTFNYYDGDAFIGLPFGQLGDFGALVRTASLVLTEEILRESYRDPDNPTNAPSFPPYLRPEGLTSWSAEYPQEFRDRTQALVGYTFADGSDHRSRGYFAHASRVAFDFQMLGLPRRGLPITKRDPLGNDTTIAYDQPYHLLPVQVTDAVGLTISAEYDYRVLQPRLVTDANGNRHAVTFSPLGLVTATAVMGKEGELVGDTLEAPGSRLEYDFFAFVNRQQPVFVRSIVREHHITETDVTLRERDETIETVEYSDGFGRLLQTLVQSEEIRFGNPVFGGGILSVNQGDETGTRQVVVGQRNGDRTQPNVVVSGWQIYDNKGRVVEKYEPFYSVGWDYIAPTEAQLGQKAEMDYDPRGQVIRTVNPDGSEQRMIYGIPMDLTQPEQFTPTPWEAYTYDANDNAGRTHAAQATRYQPHWNTPASIVIDALGRTIAATARNGSNLADWYVTRSTYDIRGNVLAVTDALGRVAFRYTYDLANRPWRTDSIDAGVRRTVLDAIGNAIEQRDSKGALVLHTYDEGNRPTRLYARDGLNQPLTLRQYSIYGDRPESGLTTDVARQNNLLGKLYRHYDEAGWVTAPAYDFKGNPLSQTRQVISDTPLLSVFNNGAQQNWEISAFRVDWQPPVGTTLDVYALTLLDATPYMTSMTYDALNRVKAMRYPQDVTGQRQELVPVYNRAGGLAQVKLNGQIYVEQIAYSAKGQRVLVTYGNGVMTRYAYDDRTFRLLRLRSERYTQSGTDSYQPVGVPLQDFAYQYDLIGNILNIQDRTPASGVLNNPDAARVSDPQLAQLVAGGDALIRRFDYDPIYRLLAATGRECDRPPDESPPWADEPRCVDLTRTRAYTEQYHYDPMGNILQLQHQWNDSARNRDFAMVAGNNRLDTVTIGQTVYRYVYDTNGNLIQENLSRQFEWDYGDRMKAFRTQTPGAEPSVHAQYLYDASGMRVKKFVRKQGGEIAITVYVGGIFEYQRLVQGTTTFENNTLHVMDDHSRIALVRVGNPFPDDTSPAVKYHLGDHLGSSNVVIDGAGNWVNREEYTPYGETSFGSFAKKRYRYTGKERDEESGLNYHGARYLSVWTGRFNSVDPKISQFPQWSPFCYSLANPIALTDPTGTQPVEEQVRARLDNINTLVDDAAQAAANLKSARRDFAALAEPFGGARPSNFTLGDSIRIAFDRQYRAYINASFVLGEAESSVDKYIAKLDEAVQYFRDNPDANVIRRRTSTSPYGQELHTAESVVLQETELRAGNTLFEIRRLRRPPSAAGMGGGGGGGITADLDNPVDRGPGSWGRAGRLVKFAGDVAMAISVTKHMFLVGTDIREGHGWSALKETTELVWDVTMVGPILLGASEERTQLREEVRQRFGHTREAEEIIRESCLAVVNGPSCRQ